MRYGTFDSVIHVQHFQMQSEGNAHMHIIPPSLTHSPHLLFTGMQPQVGQTLSELILSHISIVVPNVVLIVVVVVCFVFCVLFVCV